MEIYDKRYQEIYSEFCSIFSRFITQQCTVVLHNILSLHLQQVVLAGFGHDQKICKRKTGGNTRIHY